jgi:hypothetical protein
MIGSSVLSVVSIGRTPPPVKVTKRRPPSGRTASPKGSVPTPMTVSLTVRDCREMTDTLSVPRLAT